MSTTTTIEVNLVGTYYTVNYTYKYDPLEGEDIIEVHTIDDTPVRNLTTTLVDCIIDVLFEIETNEAQDYYSV